MTERIKYNRDFLEQLKVLFTKVFVWTLLAGLLFMLRSFFLLIFLTFVFSYILSQTEKKYEHRINNRLARVSIISTLFLLILICLGLVIVPLVKEQSQLLAEKFPNYVHNLDQSLYDLADKYNSIKAVIPDIDIDKSKGSISLRLFQESFGNGDTSHTSLNSALFALKNAGTKLFAIGSSFLLSLLFSFLIVLDLPALARQLNGLKETKLSFIYHEVADSIFGFAQVLGRALEAQLFIAILNTILTSIGLFCLSISKIALLSVIVFVCSFIPVAGVFMSSVPICIMALTDYGFSKMFMVIGMVIIVHMIETYILNPKIYGHHLRLNPVVVLIILTVGGKLFHVWGLVLGVPICTYIFGHAIRGGDQSTNK
jgi:predicted PurR-regulated permease PerM